MRQERQGHPKQAKPKAKGKRIVEEKYHLKMSQPAYFAHPFGHPAASTSIGLLGSQMQWCSPHNDAKLPDLESISTNLDKLSTDDANGFLGLGGTSPATLLKVGIPDK
jgi:hypothetical protein